MFRQGKMKGGIPRRGDDGAWDGGGVCCSFLTAFQTGQRVDFTTEEKLGYRSSQGPELGILTLSCNR